MGVPRYENSLSFSHGLSELPSIILGISGTNIISIILTIRNHKDVPDEVGFSPHASTFGFVFLAFLNIKVGYEVT